MKFPRGNLSEGSRYPRSGIRDLTWDKFKDTDDELGDLNGTASMQ